MDNTKPTPEPGQIWEDDFGWQIMITTPVSIGGPGIPDKEVVGYISAYEPYVIIRKGLMADIPYREYDRAIALYILHTYYNLIQK